jgi:hypothetical protein
MAAEHSEVVEPKSKGRRSQRIVLSLPVTVEADSADQPPFTERTHTLVVNAHGALIALAMRVAIGHRLLLENPQTQETQPSRVVYLGAVHEGKTLIGVAFLTPAPGFWQVSFPPEDWTLESPESKAITQT